MQRFFAHALAATVVIANLAASIPVIQAAPPQDEQQDRQQLEQFLEMQGGARSGGRGGSGRSARSRQSFDQQLFGQGQTFGQSPSQGNAPPTAETAASNEPKVPVALHLWVLTINLPAHKAADPSLVNLSNSASDLPAVVGSLEQVRTLIDKLKAAELMQRSREFRFLAMSGEPSSLTNSVQVPVATGTTINALRGGGGGRNNTINYQNVGTTLQLLPRIEPNGDVRVQLTFSTSDVEKDPEVVLSESDDGSRVPATRTTSRNVQANVRIKTGTAVLVQSEAESTWAGEPGRRTQLIILGATALPASE